MKLFIDNFRVWWQKPADASKRDTHREVSQLELFYDLVYVALIIQLTHLVAGHVSIVSVFEYIAIFLMMFWAWFNGSLYHELHANPDLKTRVVIFAQMLCLIGMGIFIHSAFGEGYRGFALLPIGKTATLWLAFACLQAPIFFSLVLWVRSQSGGGNV